MQDTVAEPEMSEAAGAEDRRLGHLRVFGRLGPESETFRRETFLRGQECACAHHRFPTPWPASPALQPPSITLLSRTHTLCTIHHPFRLLEGGRLREIDFELGCHLGVHRGLRRTTRKGLVDFFCGDAATLSTPPRPAVTVRWSGRPLRTLWLVCES